MRLSADRSGANPNPQRQEVPFFNEAVEAVGVGDTAKAVGLLQQFVALRGDAPHVSAECRRSVLPGLKHLLECRGFLVETPAQLHRSLLEIRLLGADFDLYDLCRALAWIDRAQTGPGRHRALPDLALFVETPSP